MAADSSTCHPGLPADGVRRLDRVERGVHGSAKRLSAPCGIRLHVPGRKVRYCYDLVRSWAIVTIASSAGGAAITVAAIRGFR